jgi:ribonuclease/clavin/mitogillin
MVNDANRTMVRRAAAVVPVRADGHVLVGQRTVAARSYPGYIAFPGGGLEEDDGRLPRVVDDVDDADLRGCALRELGEETGRWPLVTEALERPSPEHVRRFTDTLVSGLPLAAALLESALLLDDRALLPLNIWVTSDHRPMRFAVKQYVMRVSDDTDFVRTGANDEFSSLRWCSPSEIRTRWQQGDELLLPPIRHVVFALTDGTTWEDTVTRLVDVRPPDEPEAREIAYGISVQPLRTPTLPPATTTNTVLVGHGDFLIIDPATPYADERARFDALLDLLESRGRRPLAIVLTHHHIDHVGDVVRLSTTRGLPVWAHEETASRVPFPIARTIADDDMLVIDGPPTKRMRALFTPGHAAGHLAFLDEETGVLIAGDMVASEGSILIDPSEGHMGTYLASLRRLLTVGVKRVLPAHGPMLYEGAARLAEHLAHRLQRQEQVWATLPRDMPGLTAREIAERIYGGAVPDAVLPLAARSVEAALALLVEEGLARTTAGRTISV